MKAHERLGHLHQHLQGPGRRQALVGHQLLQVAIVPVHHDAQPVIQLHQALDPTHVVAALGCQDVGLHPITVAINPLKQRRPLANEAHLDFAQYAFRISRIAVQNLDGVRLAPDRGIVDRTKVYPLPDLATECNMIGG